jgi:hypothetical protein
MQVRMQPLGYTKKQVIFTFSLNREYAEKKSGKAAQKFVIQKAIKSQDLKGK